MFGGNGHKAEDDQTIERNNIPTISRGRSVEAQTNRVMMAEDRRLSGTMKWFEVNLSTGPPYTWAKSCGLRCQLHPAPLRWEDHSRTFEHDDAAPDSANRCDLTFSRPLHLGFLPKREWSGRKNESKGRAECSHKPPERKHSLR